MNVVVDSNRDVEDRVGNEMGGSILAHSKNEVLKGVGKLLNLVMEGDMLTQFRARGENNASAGRGVIDTVNHIGGISSLTKITWNEGKTKSQS